MEKRAKTLEDCIEVKDKNIIECLKELEEMREYVSKGFIFCEPMKKRMESLEFQLSYLTTDKIKYEDELREIKRFFLSKGKIIN